MKPIHSFPPLDDRAVPISPEQIAAWMAPTLLNEGFRDAPANLWSQLATYIELLLRWNRRMNLTAVRNPQELAQIHLAECVLCAQLLPPGLTTLLDFGSGAGLPGIPIQLARPEIAVTLAESQSKKASFLREAVRVLAMPQAAVCAERLNESSFLQQFDAVTLRAVDRMEEAVLVATHYLAPGGWLAVLTTESQLPGLLTAVPTVAWQDAYPIPNSRQRRIMLGQKIA